MALSLGLLAPSGGTVLGMTLENPSISSLTNPQLPENTFDTQWVTDEDLPGSGLMFFASLASVVRLLHSEKPLPP